VGGFIGMGGIFLHLLVTGQSLLLRLVVGVWLGGEDWIIYGAELLDVMVVGLHQFLLIHLPHLIFLHAVQDLQALLLFLLLLSLFANLVQLQQIFIDVFLVVLASLLTYLFRFPMLFYDIQQCLVLSVVPCHLSGEVIFPAVDQPLSFLQFYLLLLVEDVIHVFFPSVYLLQLLLYFL
jgi:hypothetical protein